MVDSARGNFLLEKDAPMLFLWDISVHDRTPRKTAGGASWNVKKKQFSDLQAKEINGILWPILEYFDVSQSPWFGLDIHMAPDMQMLKLYCMYILMGFLGSYAQAYLYI